MFEERKGFFLFGYPKRNTLTALGVALVGIGLAASIALLSPGSFSSAQTLSTISGYVTEAASGNPIQDVWVDAYNDDLDQLWSASTDASGYYEITGLPAGCYGLSAFPPPPSATHFAIPSGQDIYLATDVAEEVNFALESGISVSGTVSGGGSPLENIGVDYRNDDLDIWQNTVTAPDGTYTLTNLPPGKGEIRVSTYGTGWALAGTEVDLAGDLILRFNLVVGSCIFGRVVDENGNRVPNVEVEMDYSGPIDDQETLTDGNGAFVNCNLPPGIGGLEVRPDISSGFCAVRDRFINLMEGVSKSAIIRLKRCALVQGTVTRTGLTDPCDETEVESDGFDFEANAEVVNGSYEFRLPEGTHNIYLGTDGDGPYPLVAYPVEVTVSAADVGSPNPVIATTMNVYSEADIDSTASLRVSVENPGSAPYAGSLALAALPAGLLDDITPETMNTVGSVQEMFLSGFGTHTMGPVPLGVYDVVFFLDNERPDGLASITVIDFQNVSTTQSQAGTIIDLEDFIYGFQGSPTVSGTVLDDYGNPVLGAQVLITHTSGDLAAFAETDENGHYEIYNLPAGTYTALPSHLFYTGGSPESINAVEGEPTTANLTLAATSAISGTITYTYEDALAGKNLIIWGSDDPGFPYHSVGLIQPIAAGTSGEVVNLDYTLSNPAGVRGFIYYFIDVDGNRQPDIGEPFGYQGYMPGSSPGYDQTIIDLVNQPFYTDVDVLLQPASLTPLYFNIFQETRPSASYPDTPWLVVAYQAYAPFTAISSATVTGPGLSDPVDIRSGTDEWHEYWRRIPAASFEGGSIPSGVQIYTLNVAASGGTWSGPDNPDIDPDWGVLTVISPGNGAVVGNTPTFRWNPLDGAGRYRVEINEVGGHWSGGNIGYRIHTYYTNGTSYTPLPGVLSPGESYYFRVTADDAAGGNFSNRSRSEYRQIHVEFQSTSPPAPAFAWAVVKSEYRPGPGGVDQFRLVFGAKVIGPSPADIDSLTATWPGGNVTSLTQANLNYDEPDGTYYWYWQDMPDPIPEGDFTFAVSNSAGTDQRVVTFSYTDVPMVDSLDMTPADGTYTGTATPTFTWAPLAIDGKTTYYIVQIFDWTLTYLIYASDRMSTAHPDLTETPGGLLQFEAPADALQTDTPYKWRIQVGDGPTLTSEKNRSRTGFRGFYTGDRDPKATAFYNLAVRSDNRTDGSMRLTIGAGISLGVLPTEVTEVRMTSLNNGIDHHLGESNLLYTRQYGYEYWTGAQIPIPQDDTITYSLTTPTIPGDPGYPNPVVIADSRDFTYSPVPIVDIGTLEVNGEGLASNAYLDSTTPTFSCDPITLTAGTPYYRLSIFDWLAQKYIYISPRSTTPSITVPANVLKPGSSYGLRIRATDGPNPASENNISRSDWFWFTVQSDTDGDGIFDPYDLDDDNDGVLDGNDVFPFNPTEWLDTDRDGIGNNADLDDDNDGIEDTADSCPYDVNAGDTDGDGIDDICDLCPDDSNPPVSTWTDIYGSVHTNSQRDYDLDGIGDVCEVDNDNDGINDDGADPGDIIGDTPCTGGSTTNCDDNCRYTANPGQEDIDGDGIGNVCDPDADEDGCVWVDYYDPDDPDSCLDCEPLTFNAPGTFTVDCYYGAGEAKNTSSDSDGDGTRNNKDNCPEVSNPGQEDVDNDGVGNLCDNCPDASNSDQNDYDNDLLGDACDDSDGDGVFDATDNCKELSNPLQADSDGDGIGDACDPDADADGDGYLPGPGPSDDCDDGDPTVYPGAAELSDGKDNDCDGTIDEGVSSYHVEFTLDQNNWLPTVGQSVAATAVVKDSGGATIPHDSITFSVTNVTQHFAQFTNDPGTGNAAIDNGNDYASPSISGNQITVTSNDFGGSITIHALANVTVAGTPYTAEGDLTLPIDTDSDGLADPWEMAEYGNLSTLNSSNGDPDSDGLTNQEEFRGFRWGPELEEVPAASSGGVYQTTAWVPGSAAPQHFRSDPLRKDLFVKFSNYDVYNGFGSFSYTACPDTPDDPDSLPECPFAIGSAFYTSGVDVHLVSLDVLPAYMGGDITPWETNIEAATVTNVPGYNYGGDDGHINKLGKRDWTWDTKGWSGIGNETTYGVGTRTYQMPLDGYFADKPYHDDVWLGGNQNLLDNVDGPFCEDHNDNGTNDRVKGKWEAAANPDDNLLEGDVLVLPVSYGNDHTAFDIDGNSMVELPLVSDPSILTSQGGGYAFEYTKAQVLKHTITHEMGHAVGMNHNACSSCLMYEWSNNWNRDGNFSASEQEEMYIHK